MEAAISFKPIYLETNQGHGNARRISLENCSHNLIALMDSDDVSSPTRFAKQLHRFIKRPELDIVGGQISEFIDSPDNITGIRRVPLTNEEIRKYMKRRSPMNQVSVMFKRESVDNAGGYLDWFCEEDYYLWIRMAESGCVFNNVPDTLVNVRVGDEMSSRRGGWQYFSSEAKLQKYMLEKRVISYFRFVSNIAIRFGGEVLLSDSLRTKAYKMMRKDYTSIPNKKNKKEVNKQTVIDKERYPKFSVAMCVYGGDNAEWFDTALKSVINQTIPPDEIVLVVDGPIPNSIQDVIAKYSQLCMGGGYSPECGISP